MIKQFLESHSDVIISSTLILIIGSFAFYLVTRFFRYLEKRYKQYEFSTTFKIVRRILRGFIVLLVLFLLAKNFLKENNVKLVEQNFELAATISMIAILTVIFASISRVIFSNLIDKIDRQDDDSTKYYFFRSAVEIIIYIFGFIAILMSIPQLKSFATTLLGGASLLVVIAGFAAQEALGNIIAGVLIIFSKPFRLGDLIRISDDQAGTVWDISLRHTILKDFENRMIVIPNSVINKEKIVNFNLDDARTCERIEFNISFESNPDLARKIMAEEAEKHPFNIDIRTYEEIEAGEPRVLTRVIRLTEYSLIVRVWAWARVYDEAFVMRCELVDSIKKRFDKEGVVIPYPHRAITYKKEE